MSNKEALHQLFDQCQKIDFNESHEIISSAKNSDEADFSRMATDLILKQKHKKIINENKF